MTKMFEGYCVVDSKNETMRHHKTNLDDLC